jgi:hypothetical protein
MRCSVVLVPRDDLSDTNHVCAEKYECESTCRVDTCFYLEIWMERVEMCRSGSDGQ